MVINYNGYKAIKLSFWRDAENCCEHVIIKQYPRLLIIPRQKKQNKNIPFVLLDIFCSDGSLEISINIFLL